MTPQPPRNRIKVWVEAMRLRTLPVSVAGVVAGCAYAVADGVFAPLPALLCLAFALLAQIASNFANEYFDYRAGFDTDRRTGPRRGVSCGDISARAMLGATMATLAVACAVGCTLIAFGGWWLLPAGVAIALGALAYSAGPYPLSRHCLGEAAVVLFFGVVPVTLTYYVQALTMTRAVTCGSVAIGLLGAMVLITNNYRDTDEDRATGKHTLATRFGRRAMAWLYLLCGLAAALLLLPLGAATAAAAATALFGFTKLRSGRLPAPACIRLLAVTSLATLATALLLFLP